MPFGLRSLRDTISESYTQLLSARSLFGFAHLFRLLTLRVWILAFPAGELAIVVAIDAVFLQAIRAECLIAHRTRLNSAFCTHHVVATPAARRHAILAAIFPTLTTRANASIAGDGAASRTCPRVVVGGHETVLADRTLATITFRNTVGAYRLRASFAGGEFGIRTAGAEVVVAHPTFLRAVIASMISTTRALVRFCACFAVIAHFRKLI